MANNSIFNRRWNIPQWNEEFTYSVHFVENTFLLNSDHIPWFIIAAISIQRTDAVPVWQKCHMGWEIQLHWGISSNLAWTHIKDIMLLSCLSWSIFAMTTPEVGKLRAFCIVWDPKLQHYCGFHVIHGRCCSPQGPWTAVGFCNLLTNHLYRCTHATMWLASPRTCMAMKGIKSPLWMPIFT